MTRRQLSICTIGAAQHGKSALTRALLKKLRPGEPEVEQRGALRSNHYAFETSYRRYQLYDPSADLVPKYLATQVSGIDGAILVVSSSDGVTPDVAKHVELAQLCGVPDIAPFLNKCDLVANDRSMVECGSEVVKLLRAYKYKTFEPAFVSGTCVDLGDNDPHEDAIQQLIDLMDRAFRSRYD